MVKDLVKNLCLSLRTDIGGVSGATSRKVVVATPVITLTGNSVTITCDTTGATIYYTLDGSTPTSSSSQYSSAFTLDSSCTIKAIAIKGGKSSGIAEEEYVKPITYLTQWKIVGNSTVHTDEYLTQWKVEGNSVVDNNAILSCGDYSDVDGKYHVKISNGVTIYDIALTEPLRKVNDVADTIEFANGVATLTRVFGSDNMGDMPWSNATTNVSGKYRCISASLSAVIKAPSSNANRANILIVSYNATSISNILNSTEGIGVSTGGTISVYDENYNQSDSANAFKTAMAGVELIYELATPTTEVIQVSPFPVSATDTYTSANDTPYSAFEYKKNVEIWSCGEYSEVDNKWHIRILPEGYGIVDIALDEPLRKVNDVADNIEFADGVGTLTRAFGKVDWLNDTFEKISASERIYFTILNNNIKTQTLNILSSLYITVSSVWASITDPVAFPNLHINSHPTRNMLRIVDEDKNDLTAVEFAQANANAGVEIIYELATPTTETIQVPQIQEADSYSCVISQGGKAVEWSSFETE